MGLWRWLLSCVQDAWCAAGARQVVTALTLPVEEAGWRDVLEEWPSAERKELCTQALALLSRGVWGLISIFSGPPTSNLRRELSKVLTQASCVPLTGVEAACACPLSHFSGSWTLWAQLNDPAVLSHQQRIIGLPGLWQQCPLSQLGLSAHT